MLKRRKTPKLSVLEGRQRLLSTATDVEVKQIMANVPDAGKFNPVWVEMRYYGTEHTAFLYAEHDAAHGCRLRASVNPKGTDLEISNYIFCGSRQDCIDWLTDESHIDELIGIYNHLAQAADDRV